MRPDAEANAPPPVETPVRLRAGFLFWVGRALRARRSVESEPVEQAARACGALGEHALPEEMWPYTYEHLGNATA